MQVNFFLYKASFNKWEFPYYIKYSILFINEGLIIISTHSYIPRHNYIKAGSQFPFSWYYNPLLLYHVLLRRKYRWSVDLRHVPCIDKIVTSMHAY